MFFFFKKRLLNLNYSTLTQHFGHSCPKHLSWEQFFNSSARPRWLCVAWNQPCAINHRLYLVQLCRLCSGMLDVRNVLKHKVKLGLGTGGNRAHLAPDVAFLFFLFSDFDYSQLCKKTGTSTYHLSRIVEFKRWKNKKRCELKLKQLLLLSSGGKHRRGRRILCLHVGCCEEGSGCIKDLEHSGPRVQHAHLWGGLQTGHSGRKPRLENNWLIFDVFVCFIWMWQAILWLGWVNSKFGMLFSSLGPGWPNGELWGGQRFWCTQSKRGCTWWTHWHVREQRTKG